MNHRKVVLHNYLDEVRVMNKIINQGRRAIEGNEYFLELRHSNNHAYFNFKDFKKYGTNINLEIEKPINLLRYCNIEFQKHLSKQEVEMHTGVNDTNINLVGLAIGPFDKNPIQCVRKENLVNIYDITLNYKSNNKIKKFKCENGYLSFLKIIKYFFVNTIVLKTDPNIELIIDSTEIKNLNSNLFDKIIYWIYDIDKDIYNLETYENVKSYNFQENIRYMNAKLYDDIIYLFNKKLINLIEKNNNLSLSKIESLIELFSFKNKLYLKPEFKREIIINKYLRNNNDIKITIPKILNIDKLNKPYFEIIPDKKIYKIRINTLNPLSPKEHIILKAYDKESQDIESIISKSDKQCRHEIEWKELYKLRIDGLNKYNAGLTNFIEKFVTEKLEAKTP
jgi:hypothetical protein